MAFITSLRVSSLVLSPRISPPISHTFSSIATINPSKSMASNSKGLFAVTHKKNSVSTRASISQYSPTIAEDLGDVSIFSASGVPVMFKDLWDQNEVSVAYNSYYQDLIFTLITLLYSIIQGTYFINIIFG